MRLLITGSRTWDHRASIARVIDHALARAGDDGLLVIHGGADGADSLAEVYVRRQYAAGARIDSHIVRARWSVYGRAAGPRRNAEMVRLGADLAAAFTRDCADPRCRRERPHGSHGATHCAGLIERAGIPLVTVTWDQRDNYQTKES